MGDNNAHAESGPESSRTESSSEFVDTGGRQYHSSAFHSQLQYASQLQSQPVTTNVAQYGQRPFDMGGLASALPPTDRASMNVPTMNIPDPGGLGSMYTGPPTQQYQVGRGVPFDMPPAARMQQHHPTHYATPAFSSLPHQMSMMQRQPMQTNPGQYAPFDPYAFGMPTSFDPRMQSVPPYGMAPGMLNEFGRRASEPAPIPSYPRGPPRKPRQSGHALWVGNLPPNANVTDLKDHFSRDATKDIESLFLISKSNCAFVNYRSEAACVAAMARFADSRFHGVRLVCRLRRGSSTGANQDTAEASNELARATVLETPELLQEPSSPTIVGGSQGFTSSSDREASSNRPEHMPERFFIVKSLTTQDLEASVRNGIWATQAHNEKVLNEAYDTADNVYLIFSANKSGEYFGYARMASTIAGEPVNLNPTPVQAEAQSPGTPQSIPTPATATAPRGRIIDDSGRGTIFWEADHSDDEESRSPVKGEGENSGNANWGRQFSIEWISTARLPFYRCRGLRNPWNANREIKIARDGTELEPSVGARLIRMFHQSPGPSIPYQ